ncbi:hypothetical protein STEG23_004780 [Scotinomys teguina]
MGRNGSRPTAAATPSDDWGPANCKPNPQERPQAAIKFVTRRNCCLKPVGMGAICYARTDSYYQDDTIVHNVRNPKPLKVLDFGWGHCLYYSDFYPERAFKYNESQKYGTFTQVKFSNNHIKKCQYESHAVCSTTEGNT